MSRKTLNADRCALSNLNRACLIHNMVVPLGRVPNPICVTHNCVLYSVCWIYSKYKLGIVKGKAMPQLQGQSHCEVLQGNQRNIIKLIYQVRPSSHFQHSDSKNERLLVNHRRKKATMTTRIQKASNSLQCVGMGMSLIDDYCQLAINTNT